MRTYHDICKSVGYDRQAGTPAAEEQWAAYKEGKVSMHPTKAAALKVSPMVEEVNACKVLKRFYEKQDRLCKQARELFERELRAEFLGFTDEQYALLYEHAFDESCDCGYDAVALATARLADFIKKFNSVTTK